MKKFRIDIKESSPGRRFWLFASSRQLWAWIRSCYEDPSEALEEVPDGAHEVVLKHGDFIEAEWWGCEIMQEGRNWRHLNIIRCGQVQASDNSSGNVVTIHAGWVIDSILPMHDYEDENIIVCRVGDDSELDLDDLFRRKGIEM